MMRSRILNWIFDSLIFFGATMFGASIGIYIFSRYYFPQVMYCEIIGDIYSILIENPVMFLLIALASFLIGALQINRGTNPKPKGRV